MGNEESEDAMEIFRATAGDLDGINSLLHQVLEVHAALRGDLFISGTKKYTDTELLDIFENPDTPVFVAKERIEDAVLGYCFCEIQETKGGGNLHPHKTLYIDDLCVDEHQRGKHIATSLYAFVKDFAQQQGCYNITLNVWSGNDSARRFYEAMGMFERKTMMEEIL